MTNEPIDLPDDVVLSVRGVSKKFCRNLRRSMWYGVQDLARNMMGSRPRVGKNGDIGFIGDSRLGGGSVIGDSRFGRGSVIGDSGLDGKGSSHFPMHPIPNETHSPIPNAPNFPISNATLSPLPNEPNSQPQMEQIPNATTVPNLLSPAAPLASGGALRRDEFWALQDINFQLKRGEVLGLIGPNGSGKSTLLRLLTGIYPPDAGEIAVRGRVGALIALGAGFHPHMTGRENVYLNGTILGLTRGEIARSFDSIVDFAEIGDFIDAPVATYSSGMVVRLGFSIATALSPDLLLVDEVLAVGDLRFTLKCLNKIGELIRNTAVVFVSHNMENVSLIANQIMIMDHGHVKCHEFEPAAGLDYYYRHYSGPRDKKVMGAGEAELRSLCFIQDGKPLPDGTVPQVSFGGDLEVEMTYELYKPVKEPEIRLLVIGKEPRELADIPSQLGSCRLRTTPGIQRVRVRIKGLGLNEGIYSLSFCLGDRRTVRSMLRVDAAANFSVTHEITSWAPWLVRGEWTVPAT